MKKKYSCLLTDKGESFYKWTRIACTLLARDYKGLGTYPGNAVIEVSYNTQYGDEEEVNTEIKQLGNCMAIEGHRANPNQGRVYDQNYICPTLNTMGGGNRQPMIIDKGIEKLEVRKFTPRECWRLMNIKDECFDKAEKVNSNTRLYAQAGNAIVVAVLCAVFSQTFEPEGEKWNDHTEDEIYEKYI